MDKTLEQRKEEFVKEYGELAKKHNMDFANYPIYVPNEDGSFKTMIQTVTVEMAIKSNFMEDDKKD